MLGKSIHNIVSFLSRTCILVLPFLLLLFSLADAEIAPPDAVVKKWTKLYGRKTTTAALLTTDRFREGKPPTVWGEKTEARLKSFGYQHLGGKIVSSQVSGDIATIV